MHVAGNTIRSNFCNDDGKDSNIRLKILNGYKESRSKSRWVPPLNSHENLPFMVWLLSRDGRGWSVELASLFAEAEFRLVL